MANIGFSIGRGTKSEIDSTTIKDGQMLFTIDQDYNKIYTDVGTERIQIGGGTELYNGLDSTDTTKALSANQGKVLNDNLTTTNSNVAKVSSDLDELKEQVEEKNGIDLCPIKVGLSNTSLTSYSLYTSINNYKYINFTFWIGSSSISRPYAKNILVPMDIIKERMSSGDSSLMFSETISQNVSGTITLSYKVTGVYNKATDTITSPKFYIACSRSGSWESVKYCFEVRGYN